MRLPGIDLVLDGAVASMTDPGTLEHVAAGYGAGGWPAQVDGDAFMAPFSAPSAGPPPWQAYRFTFHRAESGACGIAAHFTRPDGRE